MSVNSQTEDFWDLAVIGGKRLLQTCFGFLDNATGDKAAKLILLPHINRHGCTSISSVVFSALLWQDHKIYFKDGFSVLPLYLSLFKSPV